MMSPRTCLLLLLVTAAAACGGEPERRFPLRGQIISLDASRREVTIKHDAIDGFMEAMTMPFRVRDAGLLEGFVAGDLVEAELVVQSDSAYLASLRKIGHADIAQAPPARSAASGFELLRVGEDVPDERFVTQDGDEMRLSEARGKAVALTFIYTRCPLPTFCPMMDRHFKAMQDEIAKDPALRESVQLFSVTFDPEFDTPAVLTKHMEGLQADPTTWSFLTGDRDAITRFAARFGVTVTRAQEAPEEIAHNLRTLVITPDGKLHKVYMGYDWSPSDVLADLRSVLPA